ncbi:MAG: DsbA family protein [Myxococcales bacterium]|nr:DsbA family protein [Myxococcales bacterium]
MKAGAAFVGMVATAAIGFAVGYAVRDGRDGGSGPAPTAKVDEKPAAPSDAAAENVYKVPVGDAYVQGPDDALVTIVEFSDFQCPYCSRVGPTLEQISKDYGKDVRIAFKHNPLPFHREAPLASEYALAAGEQGKFWEMHDKLFENQKALKKEDLDKYATELGLDLAKIEAYVASGKGKEIIRKDQELARQIGANGTPTFFVNGVQLAGAQPLPNFKRVIDTQLSAAKAMVAKGTKPAALYEKIIANGRTSPPPPRRVRRPVVLRRRSVRRSSSSLAPRRREATIRSSRSSSSRTFSARSARA